MKQFFLFFAIITMATSAFAEVQYTLIAKTVVPETQDYPCENSANLQVGKDAYAFVYEGVFQQASNPGVYFMAVNQGRVCIKSQTYGATCNTVTGTENPLSLVKQSCTTLLPIRCKKAQNETSLQQDSEGNITLSYVNFKKGGVQKAVCVYKKN